MTTRQETRCFDKVLLVNILLGAQEGQQYIQGLAKCGNIFLPGIRSTEE